MSYIPETAILDSAKFEYLLLRLNNFDANIPEIMFRDVLLGIL
jgi:hypothetical protein